MNNGLNKTLYKIKDSNQEYEIHDIDSIAKRWGKKANIWDEQLSKHDSHLNQGNAYNAFLQDAKKLTALPHLKIDGRMCVLEVGCGTAIVSDYIQSNDIDIFGIDVSKNMLAEATKKHIANSEFIEADIFNLDSIALPKFDLLLSRGILLSHYSKASAKKLLQALYGLGKPNHSVAMLDFLNNEASDPSHHKPANKSYYLPEELLDLASQVGFRDCRFTGINSDRVKCIVLFF
jgi:SAM-dependent methyltransferase